MKKYKVVIEETLTYEIEVEAKNEEEAEQLAFASEAFTNNFSDDNDAKMTKIDEID